MPCPCSYRRIIVIRPLFSNLLFLNTLDEQPQVRQVLKDSATHSLLSSVGHRVKWGVSPLRKNHGLAQGRSSRKPSSLPLQLCPLLQICPAWLWQAYFVFSQATWKEVVHTKHQGCQILPNISFLHICCHFCRFSVHQHLQPIWYCLFDMRYSLSHMNRAVAPSLMHWRMLSPEPL